MDLSKAREVLSKRGWLTQTPAAFREDILSHCTLHHFSAGETIYVQGEESKGLWGLAEGTLGLEHSGDQRDPSYVYFATRGFWIGAHTLVLNVDRQFGLMAIRPSTLLHVSAPSFGSIQHRVPEAWRWLSVLPLFQVNLAIGTLQDLMIRDQERRCAAILLRLAGCRGPFAMPDPEEVFVTQEQLSEMLNLSRTVLGGTLRSFESRGLIARQYGRMTVNRGMLEAVVLGR